MEIIVFFEIFNLVKELSLFPIFQCSASKDAGFVQRKAGPVWTSRTSPLPVAIGFQELY